jgi:CheY-specific phosphatase CheX
MRRIALQAEELKFTDLTHGIEEIVSSIFENMLGLPTSARIPGSGTHPSKELRAVVTFTGCWHGTVSIECTRVQACHFAQRFLSLPACQINDQIAWDVLGELTNMIAGNLKPLFASDIRLSIATVSMDESTSPVILDHEIQKELFFLCAEGQFLAKVCASRG